MARCYCWQTETAECVPAGPALQQLGAHRVQLASQQLQPRFQSALSAVLRSGGHWKSHPRSMACTGGKGGWR